jgi:nucleotide-binding universal stress UspA family protein
MYHSFVSISGYFDQAISISRPRNDWRAWWVPFQSTWGKIHEVAVEAHCGGALWSKGRKGAHAMMAKKILFPTDFSTTTQSDLEHAATLAHDTGATLLILHVEEPPAAYAGGEMYYGPLMVDDAERRQMLGTIKPRDPGIQYEHRIAHGDPAHEIVHVADQEHVDLIVMSAHDHGFLRRLLKGSVIESVVRHARCPVLTLKHPTTMAQAT